MNLEFRDNSLPVKIENSKQIYAFYKFHLPHTINTDIEITSNAVQFNVTFF